MSTVREMLDALRAAGLLVEAGAPITTDAFQTLPSGSAPTLFEAFLESARDHRFELGGIEFVVYRGVSARNLNETFSPRGDYPTYHEYDAAYLFAGSLQESLSLGIDLGATHLGWIFCYFDAGHGADTQSGYLYHSIIELLEALMHPTISPLEPFAPMVAC